MDSPVLTQLFRQLFSHPACQSSNPIVGSSYRRVIRGQYLRLSACQRRSLLTRKTNPKTRDSEGESFWTKRGDYPRDISRQMREFPTITAKDLRNHRERPTQVKMLTREFIDGKGGFTLNAILGKKTRIVWKRRLSRLHCRQSL